MTAIASIETIKPADLPAPPETAIQIMRACSHKEVNHKELSALAKHDPLLCAELLRVVNSSFYGFARQVKSISRAVTLLGQRALRNLALCIAVRDVLRKKSFGFDTTTYWEDSLRRAAAAKLLGKTLAMDADECFTAGLLQDFGLLVLFYRHPEMVAQWSEIRGLDPDNRYAKEQALFGITHDQVVELLGRAWDLPEELVEALGQHHRNLNIPKQRNSPTLSEVLHCADWAALVYSARDKKYAIKQCRKMLSDNLGMSLEQVDAYLSQIPHQALEAARVLGLRMRPQEDFEAILCKANLRLVEENISYQELTQRLEKALEERDKLAAELAQELELAREIQRSLLPGHMPPDFPATAINLPARELSGDFFDYFSLEDGCIYFNLADVSGKGMNAALLMAKTSSLFRCLGKQIREPGKLLAQINDEIYETTTHGMFVTMIAGLFNPVNGDLRIVNAGHLPALLFGTNDKVAKIGAQAPPLGILPETEFPETRITLCGQKMYLFSDGVTEAQTDEGGVLGIQGLVTMIAEFAAQPPRQRLESIVKRLTLDGVLLRDDITLLLLQSSS